MANKNYYEILGVSKDATDEEIKTAFKKMTKKYHPDLHATKTEAEKKEMEEKFKEINEAFNVLSDKEKRANYDRFGSAEGPQFGSGSGFGGFSTEGFGGLDDILNSVFSGFGFGGGQRRRSQQYQEPGKDIQLNLQISLEEAIFGVEKTLKFTKNVKCQSCQGTGAKNGTAYHKCSQCNGSGVVEEVRNTFLGQMKTQSTCPSCNGAGKIITEKCKECKSGYIKKEITLIVKVPAGINNNQILTYENQGEPSYSGGPNGDVNVIIAVNNNTQFVREGYDLRLRIPISFTQAALGSEVEIKTFRGDSCVFKIPKGTQSETTFRLKGKGIKYLGKETKGDIYATVYVEIPKSLSKEQEKTLQNFEETLVGKNIPKIEEYKKKNS